MPGSFSQRDHRLGRRQPRVPIPVQLTGERPLGQPAQGGRLGPAQPDLDQVRLLRLDDHLGRREIEPILAIDPQARPESLDQPAQDRRPRIEAELLIRQHPDAGREQVREGGRTEPAQAIQHRSQPRLPLDQHRHPEPARHPARASTGPSPRSQPSPFRKPDRPAPPSAGPAPRPNPHPQPGPAASPPSPHGPAIPPVNPPIHPVHRPPLEQPDRRLEIERGRRGF